MNFLITINVSNTRDYKIVGLTRLIQKIYFILFFSKFKHDYFCLMIVFRHKVQIFPIKIRVWINIGMWRALSKKKIHFWRLHQNTLENYFSIVKPSEISNDLSCRQLQTTRRYYVPCKIVNITSNANQIVRRTVVVTKTPTLHWVI